MQLVTGGVIGSPSKKSNSIINQNVSPNPLLKFDGCDDSDSIQVMMDYKSLKMSNKKLLKTRSGTST